MPRKPYYGGEYEYHPEELAEEDEEIVSNNESSRDYMEEELARLEERYAEKQAKKEKKKRIRETKRKIRKLKYAPVFEAGEKAKIVGGKMVKGVSDVIGKEKARRATPEYQVRKVERKEKLKQFRERAKKGMMSIGDGKAIGGDMFSGGGGMDMIGKQQAPRIFEGGSGLLAGGDLFGGGTPNIMKGNLLGKPIKKKRKTKRRRRRR